MILAESQSVEPGITVPDPAPDRDAAMRHGMTLLMMLSITGVVLVSMLALWLTMRTSRRNQTRPQRVPTDISVDAWAEAARRLDDTITEFDEEL